MPELPEVECLVASLNKVLPGRKLSDFWFGRSDLRWPIPIVELQQKFANQTILSVERRSKYMIILTDAHALIMHLGMSGNLVFLPSKQITKPHTHGIFTIVENSRVFGYLHYIDPRRFGSIHFIKNTQLKEHPLLKNLGPEPLATPRLAENLYERSRGKIVAIKTFIMNAKHLVGVGNIYANESLFLSGIHPCRRAKDISMPEWKTLVTKIKLVLNKAILAGGTSIKDYVHLNGETGYFKTELCIYGKDSEPCPRCQTPISLLRIGGRATYFCPKCQKLTKP